MQSSSGDELVVAVQRLIAKKLGDDPEMKALLVALAKVVLATCDEGAEAASSVQSAPEPVSQPATIIARPGEAGPAKPTIVGPRVTSEGIVPLKIGGVQMHLRVEGSSGDIARARQSIVEADATEPKHNTLVPADEGELLELIVKRTSIKMRSCDVAKQRRAAEKTGEGRDASKTMVQPRRCRIVFCGCSCLGMRRLTTT
jgi:hypothetical protein